MNQLKGKVSTKIFRLSNLKLAVIKQKNKVNSFLCYLRIQVYLWQLCLYLYTLKRFITFFRFVVLIHQKNVSIDDLIRFQALKMMFMNQHRVKVFTKIFRLSNYI
jgi:hypothetical protein